MKNSIQVLLFSSILAIVCAAFLYAVTQFTDPYQKLNQETDKDINYLTALGVPFDSEAKPSEILQVFKDNISVSKMKNLTLFEYIPKDSDSKKPVAIAVPFSGPGFWAPIKGVLAFEPDLLTLKGVRFYEQEETPGLGGEIASEWFQAQFNGKMIVSKSGDPGFKIVKEGTPGDLNSVDAITGATRTSERVATMLDSIAKKIYKERKSYVGK